MKDKVSVFDLTHASYTRKWLTMGILTGIVAGLGSVLFFWLIKQVTELMLGLGAGADSSTYTCCYSYTAISRC